MKVTQSVPPVCRDHDGVQWSLQELFCLGLLLLLGLGFQARAAVDWPVLGFTQVVPTSFSNPTCITHAGDGSQRLFVAERGGRVLIIQNGSVLAQPFLDITDRVGSAPNGVLGLAFAPGFATNGHVYVCYVRKSDGWVAVSRFQLSADPNVADASSEQVILAPGQACTRGLGHDAGQIAFGPDGYLYVGTGDSGQQGDPQNLAQNPQSLRGKILRLDVEGGVSPYAIPPGNPFAGNTNYAPEIWALGLRNPQHFSFDRVTGDLYIGDAYEPFPMHNEVNFQPAGCPGGLNYGWRIMQGPTNYTVPAGFTNFAALSLPVASYKLSDMTNSYNCWASVTGGHVYRGPGEPRLDGVYFFGDYYEGFIWGMKQVGTNWQRQALLSPVYSSPFIPIISAFGEDEQGHLYLADYNRGRIFQIQDTHQAWAPVFSPTNGFIGSNSVSVSCLTSDVEIHYTTNGADPTLSDPFVFSGGTIPAFTGQTNKARAFRADLSPSAVVSAVFTNKVATPCFTPPAGAITNRTPVMISTVTPDATIHYTLNGTTPTTQSPVYSSPLSLSGSVTLKALAVAPGYSNSAVATAAYSALPAATPTFTPSGGLFTNATSVAISCATPGALIRYTLDGTTPDTNAPLYSSPLLLSTPTTLKAVAYREDLGPSPLQSAFYGFLRFDRTVVTTFAGTTTAGFSNAPATLARFATPQALALTRAGTLLVGDRGNHVIREVLPAGTVQTFAGSGTDGFQDGPAAIAQFQDSAGVCCDAAGNVFVSEGGCGAWRLREVDTNGMVTTLATVINVCYRIGQLEIDPAHNLYAGYGNLLNKISPDGQSKALGGYGDYYAYIGVGIDEQTNVYAAEAGQLWQITPDGTQTLFAGSTAATGFSDGPRLLAVFQGLQDVALDRSGNILLTDQTRVRRIGPDGLVSTVAGTGMAGYANGPGPAAQFNGVTGICVDTNGNVYVADSGNNCIRKISPDTAGIGIADEWQRLYFGCIGIDPNADPDHDGMSNYAEFWAGTHPLDANSVLAIQRAARTSNNQVEIRWPTVVGKTYSVQYSSDLVSWTQLGDPVQGDGSMALKIDSATTPQTVRRFYRIALTAY